MKTRLLISRRACFNPFLSNSMVFRGCSYTVSPPEGTSEQHKGCQLHFLFFSDKNKALQAFSLRFSASWEQMFYICFHKTVRLMPDLASWSTFQSRDRKGVKQTQLSNDSGKHFLQIVYSQNFVLEEKKRLLWLVWIFSLLPHSLHCGIFIYEVHPRFWC